MDAGLDGVLFGGEAEGVEAHWVQDVESMGPLIPADDIGGDEAQRVPDVQPDAAGVGEHIEHVKLRPPGVEGVVAGVGRVEGFLLGPSGLPLVFDSVEVVRHGATSLSGGGSDHTPAGASHACGWSALTVPRSAAAALLLT